MSVYEPIRVIWTKAAACEAVARILIDEKVETQVADLSYKIVEKILGGDMKPKRKKGYC